MYRDGCGVLAVAEIPDNDPTAACDERQVFDLMVAGAANKLVAPSLGISPRTVENHRAKILAKTDSKSITELVAKIDGLDCH